MRVRQAGGMTEFIPSPLEKREALIRDHSLRLTELLHQRLARIEALFELDTADAVRCESLFRGIAVEETANMELNRVIDQVNS